MTVEPSWRINDDDNTVEQKQDIDYLISIDMLAPDTRLQAIADAWKAFGFADDIWGIEWDALTRLLDALTEENKCSRCGGTGQVYDEVFENEWAKCPYWDHNTGIECVDGLVVALAEEER